MKDLRCRIGFHKWELDHTKEVSCSRCGVARGVPTGYPGTIGHPGRVIELQEDDNYSPVMSNSELLEAIEIVALMAIDTEQGTELSLALNRHLDHLCKVQSFRADISVCFDNGKIV